MSKIIGVGTDIVEVGRVLKSCEKHSFLNKYYTEAERELIKRRKSCAATNFAGKEAVADKLTGTIVKEIYVPKKIINIVQK